MARISSQILLMGGLVVFGIIFMVHDFNAISSSKLSNIQIVKGINAQNSNVISLNQNIHSSSITNGSSEVLRVNKTSEELMIARKITSFDESDSSNDWYFQPRKVIINPINFKFLYTADQICKEPPFLIFLCLSQPHNIDIREYIRNTWGSISRTQRWPRMKNETDRVKLVFLFGSSNNSVVKETITREENKTYGDIVQADFLDTYNNLTIKTMIGLKWTTLFCSTAKFAVKVDEDTFVHVYNLLNLLKTINVSSAGVVVGRTQRHAKVLKSGKWMLSKDVYPFNNYPLYVLGHAYVISRNMIERTLVAAEHLPHVHIEDAFITGIVRKTIGASLHNHNGFRNSLQQHDKPCDFHNGFQITVTNMDERSTNNLWNGLHRELKNCFGTRNSSVP